MCTLGARGRLAWNRLGISFQTSEFSEQGAEQKMTSGNSCQVLDLAAIVFLVCMQNLHFRFPLAKNKFFCQKLSWICLSFISTGWESEPRIWQVRMTESSVEFQFEHVEDQNKHINTDNNSSELQFGQIVRECLRQHFLEIEKLNKQQFKAIQSFIFERDDVFAILATGFGKSLIFQLAPAIAQ